MSNDQARNSIGYLIGDVERIQGEMGPELAALSRQDEDREASDIIRRIERKLRGYGRLPAQQPEAAE